MKTSSFVLIGLIIAAFLAIFVTHNKRNYPLQKFERYIRKSYHHSLYEDREKRHEDLQKLNELRMDLEPEETTRYHLALTRYHRLRHDYPKALISIEKTLELLPKKPSSAKEESLTWELPLLHGIILLKLKHYREALKTLTEALKKNPRSKYIALYLSQNHLALAIDDSSEGRGHLSDSLKFADLSLKFSQLSETNSPNEPVRSNWPAAWNQRAVVLMRRQDYHSARLDLLEAVRLEPGYPRAHYNLSLCNAFLSLRYLGPITKNDEKATTYRTEAIREWQELKKLDPILAHDLYTKAGIQNLVEGVIPD